MSILSKTLVLFFAFNLYPYSQKNIEVKPKQFQRYILPQIKNILNDFEKLMIDHLPSNDHQVFKSFYAQKNHVVSKRTLFVSKIDKQLQDRFSLVWEHYISPLRLMYHGKQSHNYLKKNLSRINMSWHQFHRDMSKSRLKNLTSSGRRMEIIHQRWKSILRLVLKV